MSERIYNFQDILYFNYYTEEDYEFDKFMKDCTNKEQVVYW